MILYKAITSFFFLLLVLSASAQSGVTIKASVDKYRILIGEQITLRLEADIPENEAISFFNLDTIAHFEILDKQKIDTVNTSNGTVLSQVIKITSFDSGHWVIQPFALNQQQVTDSFPIDVAFTPFDPAMDYHDIKDILEVEVEKEKTPLWWWAVGGAGLLLLIVLLYSLLKKKKKVIKIEKPPVDPFEEAVAGISKLRKAKTEVKEYYSGMVDIFRTYLSKRKGITSLQQTTEDLVIQLKTQPMDRQVFDKLAASLRLSDFVKFAKYKPDASDDEALADNILSAITEIESDVKANDKGDKN